MALQDSLKGPPSDGGATGEIYKYKFRCYAITDRGGVARGEVRGWRAMANSLALGLGVPRHQVIVGRS